MKNFDLFIKYNDEFLSLIFEKLTENNTNLEINTIIPIVLYNSIIEKSKSLSLLINNKQYAGVDTLGRAIFEQAVILDFIIKEDSLSRSKAFHLSNSVRNIEFANEILDTKKFNIIIKSFGLNLKEKFEAFKAYEADEYKKISEEYSKLTKAKYSKHWFKVAEKDNIRINNFKELCIFMGDKTYAEYMIVYAIFSKEAHGKDINSYYTASNNEFSLIYKEDPKLPMVIVKERLFHLPEKLGEYFKFKRIQKNLFHKYSFQFKINIDSEKKNTGFK